VPGDAAPSVADLDLVTRLLGRTPGGNFSVVKRRPDGSPMVIANDPLLRDGTPMPTRYWLLDPELTAAVARLESVGGVKDAEAVVDPIALRDAHRRYASERDALIADDWSGPRPHDGVGGTREGVKCLHAHLAWWLVGGPDPVGDWVAEQLGLERARDEPAGPSSQDG
jgi:uncharacterized protein